MGEYFQLSHEFHQLSFDIVRKANDCEMDLFTTFFNQLYSNSLRRDGEDKIVWSPSEKGVFEVEIFDMLCSHGCTPIPSKIIWHNKPLPLRVNFFAWGDGQ